jgi:hypothetical protein
MRRERVSQLQKVIAGIAYRLVNSSSCYPWNLDWFVDIGWGSFGHLVVVGGNVNGNGNGYVNGIMHHTHAHIYFPTTESKTNKTNKAFLSRIHALSLNELSFFLFTRKKE